MLTGDLVRVRRRGDELQLLALSGKARIEALAVAEALVAEARARVGDRRDDLAETTSALAATLADARLARGLVKVLDDACDYPELASEEAAALREKVWLAAAAAWRSGEYDRARVVAGFEHPEALDDAMWADQPGAARLLGVGVSTGAQLLDRYDDDGVGAVLTRAVSLTVRLERASAAELRAVLRKLSFLQLLVRAQAIGNGGYALEIEGPLSMHGSAARYGMRLAMLVPTLRGVASADLVAKVRWGRDDRELTFRAKLENAHAGVAPRVSPEVERLRDAINALDRGWRAEVAEVLVEIPGDLVIAPDLTLTRDGRTVHVEVLGHWSREAVFRRAEGAKKLAVPLLFAASSRLRVSEEVVEDGGLAGLYVWKGVMSARAVVEHAEKIGGRPTASR